jgi:hypothetical protein
MNWLLMGSVKVLLAMLLFVYSCPIMSHFSGIKIIHVNKGSGIMIQCNVTIATIHTDIYWTKNSTDSTFNVTGINLVFNDISSAVDGEYICHSMNRKTGENITLETIQVMVNCTSVYLALSYTVFKGTPLRVFDMMELKIFFPDECTI